MDTIHSSYPLMREAKVINTTDPEELGRIQLKVYPELHHIPDSDCPWCFPHTGGVHGKSFSVPLVDQLISCVVWNRYWNEITFLPFNITKPTEHLFDDFMKNVRPLLKDIPTDPEEEHFVVERYEDDFSTFQDTKNRQHGWVHPSGAHFTINNMGDIFLWLIKMYTMHNGDDTIILEVNPEDQSVKFYQKGKLESETDDLVDIKIHKTLDLLVDQDVTKLYNANEKTDVVGNSKHTSANTDIHSAAPIGMKGTETQLGGDVLQIFFDDLIAAVTRNPIIIPPVPWAEGLPVPPSPPIINMHLKGVWSDIVAAANKAKASCAKALK